MEYPLIKANHPWISDPVEQMNRKIKDATGKRYHYNGHDELRSHLVGFINAHNFARRLKTLSGVIR